MTLPAIDWRTPWFAPLAAVGNEVEALVRDGASVADALNTCGGPVRFVPQEALPDREPYEAFIFRTGCVPTRHNLHDFFNGLMWLLRPALKRRLNELQAAQIAQAGVGARRGPVRDALTLFDENAALLQAPAELVQALRERQWRRLFIDHRALWARARLELFGHALLEKLVTPYKSITAHVWVVEEGAAPDLGLSAEGLAPKPFLPLPVLGVPGWWPANEAPAFYDDAEVFRPRRERAGRRPEIIAM
ncbi:DUF3025 domain-containing protein [Caldimonas caldifontis]|uniref:DUF3025 domain-containing protein n=1 Tax=Caldimonas caldifontis TaxID=1452508 RepID=A0A2S5SZH7_9BURK|nr:DUF3025 domain-containing protein [Caldimonas caldifontis]PPE68175.1 DUF3025 domain-containing protein [Caldimonas caldifontis]